MMKYTIGNRHTIGVIALVIALCASCSFSSPSIALPKVQRLYKHTVEEGFVENLAVFAVFQDADGVNDYKELLLQENATGLEWRLHRGNTIFLQESRLSQHEQWVGSNTFAYPRGTFPAGAYTLTLSDLGGNTSTHVFTLQKPPRVTASPFQFTLNRETWQIHVKNSSFCCYFSLVMLGADLQPLRTYHLGKKETETITGTLQELIDFSPDVCYIQCFSENQDQSIGFFSAPIPVP